MWLLTQLLIYDAFWNVHDADGNVLGWAAEAWGLGAALPPVTRQCGLEQVFEAPQTLHYLTARRWSSCPHGPPQGLVGGL